MLVSTLIKVLLSEIDTKAVNGWLFLALIAQQKQLGTTLHKSQTRIDQRIKKWQELRQAVESVKVSKSWPDWFQNHHQL